MVGARVVELTPGRPETSPIAEGGLIQSEAPVELSDLMKKTGASLQKLDEVARTARTGLEEMAAIASSIREGKGTLGKLVQDEAAYQSLMSLTRRGERTVTALEDNLDALKHTWPLSRYFDSRAYYERDKLLFQPGSLRDSRTFRVEELFEPGRAILTPVGRTRLDEAAKWCKKAFKPKSEVVIAAFTDDDHDLEICRPADPGTGRVRPQVPGREARHRLGRLVPLAQGRRGRLRHPGAPAPGSIVGLTPGAAGRHHPVHAPDVTYRPH